MSYTITINGVDRKDCVDFGSPLQINDELNDDINTLNFTFQNLDDGDIPQNNDEVIYSIDGVKEFGGYIVRRNISKPYGSSGLALIHIECVEYVRILDRRLINKTYEDITDQQLIKDIIDEFGADDGITYENVGKSNIFTDNFDDNSINSLIWYTWGVGQNVIESSSQMNISSISGAGSNYFGLTTYRAWVMTDHTITVKVIDAGDVSLTSYEAFPIILNIDTSNRVYFVIKQDEIHAYKIVSGSTTEIGSAVAYVQADHVYFRIRESDGVLYFEYSKDNDTWIEHASTSTPIDFSAIEYIMQVGTWDEEATTTTMVVDDITIQADTEPITISQIRFKMEAPSQAIRRICELTGRNWYIDYDKDVHYFKNNTNPAPYNITTSSDWFKNLVITHDDTQIKNKIYVKGSTYLSDEYDDSYVADGEQRIFVLPEKPHDLTMEVDTVSKTVGIKNIDDPTDFDFLLNFQEKYVECGENTTTPTNGSVIDFHYKYEIPILISVEDSESIADDGVYEFAIFDKSITSLTAARDRATAELTDYANSIIDGSFETEKSGFRSGQVINIDDSTYGISDTDYIIVSVVKRSKGNGDFVTFCKLASKKKIGIIQYLIKQLQTNKDVIELTDDETVDQLTELDDSVVISDSIESMYLTSPPFYWSNDEGTTPNKMVWGFFEWS